MHLPNLETEFHHSGVKVWSAGEPFERGSGTRRQACALHFAVYNLVRGQPSLRVIAEKDDASHLRSPTSAILVQEPSQLEERSEVKETQSIR